MDADTIRALEHGERRMGTRNQQDIAAWARTLGLDRQILDGALSKSLEAPVEAGSYAGSCRFPTQC